MNECLPESGSSVNGRGSPEVFAAQFAEAPDLVDLSPAARRVLAVSAALFYRNGAAATSIRDITSACGLSPGALYNHFAAKDDVLFRLIEHGHEALERRIAASLAPVADRGPVERTVAFVRAYLMGHLVHPELAQVVRREYLHLSAERYRAVVARRRMLRRRLAELLGEGVAAEEFHLVGGKDAPTRAAVMVLDMCSRTSEWYDPARAEPPAELAELYVAAALRLLGAPATPPPGRDG